MGGGVGGRCHEGLFMPQVVPESGKRLKLPLSCHCQVPGTGSSLCRHCPHHHPLTPKTLSPTILKSHQISSGAEKPPLAFSCSPLRTPLEQHLFSPGFSLHRLSHFIDIDFSGDPTLSEVGIIIPIL